MKKILVAMFVCIACMATANAENIKGNGTVVSKDITVDDYSQVRFGQGISYSSITSLFSSKKNQPAVFNYSQKEGKATLKVTMDENLFQHLIITTTNGELAIYTEKNTTITPTQMVVDGQSATLRKITASGSIDFILQTSLTGDKMNIVVSGASDVRFNERVRLQELETVVSGSGDISANNLQCSNFNATVSGSGDITMRGKADRASYTVSGSGDMKMYDFTVKWLDCKVSGSGDIRAYATETINATASGSGDIRYRGEADATVRTSGSGSIKKDM